MPYAREKKPVPTNVVLWLFAAAYLTPFLVYALIGLIFSGPYGVFFAAWMWMYFPSGLGTFLVNPDGRLSDHDWGKATIFGYLIYLGLVCLATLLRKSWKSVALILVFFVVLLGVNVGGCKKVSDYRTSKIRSP